MNVTFPPEVRFVATARDLVLLAARQAGLDEPVAREFAGQVESAVRASLSRHGVADVPLVVRLRDRGIEVVAAGHVLKLVVG